MRSCACGVRGMWRYTKTCQTHLRNVQTELEIGIQCIHANACTYTYQQDAVMDRFKNAPTKKSVIKYLNETVQQVGTRPCIFINFHARTHTWTNIPSSTHSCTDTRTHTQTLTHTHTDTHTRTHAHMHTYTPCAL